MGSPSILAELSRPLLTLAVAFVAFLVGRATSIRSPMAARSVAALAGIGAVLSGAAHYPPLRPLLAPLLAPVGGEGVCASICLLALLGYALGTGRVNRILMVAGAVVAAAVLVVESGAPLWWRLFGAEARANFPDTRGMVQQSSGVTCGAAAGVMLLNRVGVRASEGLVAELAATNPLVGTDEYQLARAMDRAANGRFHASAAAITLERANRLGKPFVAYVRRPGVGGHALLVEWIRGDKVAVSDPLTGSADMESRAEFASEWTGVAIWLED